MSDRDAGMFLRDIVQAIEKIERYTTGLDYAAFSENDMAVDAVIRNFEIIGEAASHVPHDIRKLNDRIPWDKMKAMRNVMIHEYFGVDLETVWKTVKDALPRLKKEILGVICGDGREL